jgi:2-amino-4-hydroxy-6-hydroxymethyldihydropteridine diphosphokinase
MKHLSAQNLVLGLGSNEHQEACFRQTLDALKVTFGDLLISSVYQSLPVDCSPLVIEKLSKATFFSSDSGDSPAHYYNAVVVVQSELSIEEIKNVTRDIEQQCGRDRTKNTPVEMTREVSKGDVVGEIVTMDIDCLLYGERIKQSQGLSLPHENVLTMAYVLRPLAELFPDTVCPQANKTFAELWNEMSMQNNVLLEPIDFVWQDQLVSIAPPCLVL